MSQIHVANPEDAGCWLAGASNRTADELSADIIRVAIDRGMVDDTTAKETLAEFDELPSDPVSGTKWVDDWRFSDRLHFDSNRALDWLNDFVAPSGYSFELDDGLYLFKDEEESE